MKRWLLPIVVSCNSLITGCGDMSMSKARLAMDDILNHCGIITIEMYGDPLIGPVTLAVRARRQQKSTWEQLVISCVLARWHKHFGETPTIYLFEAGANDTRSYILWKDFVGGISNEEKPILVYHAPSDR